MLFFIYLVVFLLGLIIGSFLNVVILRYHSGQSINGRSHCLSCGAKLSWSELLPIASFLLQKGRCRNCQCRISWQYPLVELLTGILFVLVLSSLSFGGNWIKTPYCLIIVSLLLAIAVYDLKHKIIPDLFVVILGALALIRPLLMFFQARDLPLMLYDYKTVLLGGLASGGIFLLLWFFSGGHWLGFGDVKLAFAVGFLLGSLKIFSALILAVWSGAIVGLVLIALSKIRLFGFKKYFTIKSELPFAPFIIFGVILTLLFQVNVF